jgi:mannosyl-glycoprotein endo-beta-N-acetylglucosaminidase
VEWHVNPNNFNEDILPAVRIIASNVNVREGPSTAFPTLSFQLNSGNGPYFIMNQAEDSEGYPWYRLKGSIWVGWVRGDFVIPTTEKAEGIFQFLVLSGTTGAPAEEINNNILMGKGILEGRAEAFIQGCQQYNINEIFLVSLALHESGNGSSQLATGVQYNGMTVYNMYGIGAYDQDPINAGAKFAFEQGWFTPELAIIGGAKFASQNYINHPTYRQDTLYKMRWNPAMPGLHQYATDVGWAAKQVECIKELYELLNTYTLRFDIPRYR